MSWSRIIGSGDAPVLAVDVASALDAVSTSDLGERQLAQFHDAKAAAKALTAESLAGKYGYKFSLYGHADEGELSSPDSITVIINEVRAPVPPEAQYPASSSTETIQVLINADGEGSVQLEYPESDVTISKPPASGAATIEGIEEPEGSFVTKLVVSGAEANSTQAVELAITS